MSCPLRCALVGNPNVGKSTVFNALTGGKQRTGNWAGVTVGCAAGEFSCTDGDGISRTVELTDLPGLYSLRTHSPEEEAARQFLAEQSPDAVICVCDACAPERNLILAMEIRSMGFPVVICLNLMDEAKKRGITVDSTLLEERLGCPVIPVSARRKEGLPALCRALLSLTPAPLPPDFPPSGAFSDYAAALAREAVTITGDPCARDRRLDRIFCGKITGYGGMLLFTLLLFWLTLQGSSVLSGWLAVLLDGLAVGISRLLSPLPAPLHSLLCDGIFATVFRVVGVMLPPMAIFFPLFTLLEDLGYLPRLAFLSDDCFRRCGSCGKQSLTMLMGLGCNAAGVTGCRILDSPRERLAAILTNAFIPCNGRFPALIACLTCLGLSADLATAGLFGIFLLAVGMTLIVTKCLTATILRGHPSVFTLELPPYRLPDVGSTLLRSLLDRTGRILLRAVTAAAPAGLLLWFSTRIFIGESTVWEHLVTLLDPIGRFLGLDGVLLLSFLFALPAAELMLPLAISGGIGEVSGDIPALFAANGWGTSTILCILLFTLFHFPCATTLITIYKETRRLRWVVLAATLPTVIGCVLCLLVRLLPW